MARWAGNQYGNQEPSFYPSVVFSSAVFESYGSVMYLENGCTQEILL